jgi:hypothetical protein
LRAGWLTIKPMADSIAGFLVNFVVKQLIEKADLLSFLVERRRLRLFDNFSPD